MTGFKRSPLYICNPKLNMSCSACINGECTSSCCYSTTEVQYAQTNNEGSPYLIARDQDDQEQLGKYGDKVFSKVTGTAYVVTHKDPDSTSNKVTLLNLTNLQEITVTFDHFHTNFE